MKQQEDSIVSRSFLFLFCQIIKSPVQEKRQPIVCLSPYGPDTFFSPAFPKTQFFCKGKHSLISRPCLDINVLFAAF